jgi:hypothetical protein
MKMWFKVFCEKNVYFLEEESNAWIEKHNVKVENFEYRTFDYSPGEPAHSLVITYYAESPIVED